MLTIQTKQSKVGIPAFDCLVLSASEFLRKQSCSVNLFCFIGLGSETIGMHSPCDQLFWIVYNRVRREVAERQTTYDSEVCTCINDDSALCCRPLRGDQPSLMTGTTTIVR
eukprot:5435710-Amphidinium_carterae.1